MIELGMFSEECQEVHARHVVGGQPVHGLLIDVHHDDRPRFAPGGVARGGWLVASKDPVRVHNRHIIGDGFTGDFAMVSVAWALIAVRNPGCEPAIVGTIPGFVKPVVIEQRLFVEIRQQRHTPAMDRSSLFVNKAGRRKASVVLLVVLKRQCDLAKIARARNPARGFAGVSVGRL